MASKSYASMVKFIAGSTDVIDAEGPGDQRRNVLTTVIKNNESQEDVTRHDISLGGGFADGSREGGPGDKAAALEVGWRDDVMGHGSSNSTCVCDSSLLSRGLAKETNPSFKNGSRNPSGRSAKLLLGSQALFRKMAL